MNEERRLGQEIRRLRKLQKLNQTELAEKSDVALMTISRIERGEHDPHIRTLGRIARALGVSAFDLLRSARYFGDDQGTPTKR